MPITGKRSLSSLLRVIVDLLLILNILVLILLPWMLDAVYRDPDLLEQLEVRSVLAEPDVALRPEYPSDLPKSSYAFYLGFLYAAGVATAWILLEGHRILRRMEKSEPFAAGQTGSFHRVGIAFGVLAGAFAIKIVAYNTLLTMFCCALFLLLILVAVILAEIFSQAYAVKADNELTI